MDLTELSTRIKKRDRILELNGLCTSAPSWLISRLAKVTGRAVLYITSGPRRAEEMGMDLTFFTDLPVFVYHLHDFMPFMPVIPNYETMANRISILYQMATLDGPYIAVAPVQALSELTISRDILIRSVEYIETGEETDREALISWLIKSGYERQTNVRSRGEFSVRGGILDVFPPPI
ncbi:MAG: hypothetical protein ACP5J5_02915, partial [Dissulfurimicrobium sp.]